MSQKFNLRKATLEDVPAIEILMKLSMNALGQGYYTPEQVASACQYVCVPDKQVILDGTYFIVEDLQGRMVGCGGWSFRNTLYAGPAAAADQDNRLDPKRDCARIRAMFVHPDLSGQGVGSLILQASEEAAKKGGFKSGALGATQSGLAFYQAKGWIVTGEELATLPDGVKLEVTQMQKAL